MSLIFDALRRAESEHPGKADATSGKAGELLRRAEQRARLQRGSETRPDGSDPADPFGHLRSDASGELWAGNGLVHDMHSGPDDAHRVPLNDLETLHLPLPFQDELVVLADKESPATEAFRLLGVRLRHLRRERAVQTLLICSSATQEGKSLISANLACAVAAATQQKVLLIEGDIRRPSLTPTFQLDPRPGLCDFLSGERPLSESIYRLEEASIWFMPAGSSLENHLELINSPSLAPMVQQLTRSFAWIIIDSPPVLPLADTSVWERLADSILFVTRNSTTQKSKLERGLEAIDPDKLIGAVINSATTSRDEDYYYYRDRPSSRERTADI